MRQGLKSLADERFLENESALLLKGGWGDRVFVTSCLTPAGKTSQKKSRLPSMKDDKNLYEELKNRAIDSEHGQALIDLGEQLLNEFESGSSEAVTGILRYQMEKRRTAYNKAYKTLTETIGL